MEMPTKVNHPLFIRISSDGHIAKGDFLKDGFIETEAKAVALPEHGDLIDRKETRKQILEDLSKMKTNLPFDVFGLIIDRVDFLLTKAPTIVEATE